MPQSDSLASESASQERTPLFREFPEFDYFHRALHKREKGQNTAAVVLFKKSLGYNTNFFPSLRQLGIIYEEQGKLERAELWYRRSLTIFPDDYDLLIHYASCLIKLKRTLEGLKYLRKAEHLEPDLPNALYFRYCAYYYEAGRPDYALKGLRILLRANPDFIPALLTIAEILHSLGQVVWATIYYRRALRQDARCREALLALSAIYGNDFSHRERSLQYCYYLLAIDPNDSYARANMAIAQKLPPATSRYSRRESGRNTTEDAGGISNLVLLSSFEARRAKRVFFGESLSTNGLFPGAD